MTSGRTADISESADAGEAARRALMSAGTYLMVPTELNACLGSDVDAWRGFSAHWDDLSADPYAAELGTHRLRRYGHFLFNSSDAVMTPMPHRAFIQPENSNPLYIEADRYSSR